MIIRVIRHETNFTVIDNAALRDCTLSFKATGLLAYLLSMPDQWSPRREQLAEVKTDGQASIRTALKELVDAGYLVRRTEKMPDGTLVTVSEIHEQPLAENRPAAVRKSHDQWLENRPAVDRPAENPPAKEVTNTNQPDEKVLTPWSGIRQRLHQGPGTVVELRKAK
jgi:DNA-binding PadR family transcriptional regulator